MNAECAITIYDMLLVTEKKRYSLSTVIYGNNKFATRASVILKFNVRNLHCIFKTLHVEN